MLSDISIALIKMQVFFLMLTAKDEIYEANSAVNDRKRLPIIFLLDHYSINQLASNKKSESLKQNKNSVLFTFYS